MKTCARCKEQKELICFQKNRSNKDGLQKRCTACRKTHMLTKIDQKTQYDKKHYALNRYNRLYKSKQYYSHNVEKKCEYDVIYRKENSYKRTSWNAKRKAAKKQRTPKWLTREHLAQIEAIYALAKQTQNLFDEPFEVDHIVPLQGENVSGLHVPWNLQVLPAYLNRAKHNKFTLMEYS